MYAPPMPLESPGVRALRGGTRPTMTREMERMRNWALGQRPAAANPVRPPIDSNGNPIPPRNGDFTISPGGPNELLGQLARQLATARGVGPEVGKPSEGPSPWNTHAAMKPDRPTTPPIKPGMQPPDKSRLTGRRG